jgi:hypothetical protein
LPATAGPVPVLLRLRRLGETEERERCDRDDGEKDAHGKNSSQEIDEELFPILAR